MASDEDTRGKLSREAVERVNRLTARKSVEPSSDFRGLVRRAGEFSALKMQGRGILTPDLLLYAIVDLAEFRGSLATGALNDVAKAIRFDVTRYQQRRLNTLMHITEDPVAFPAKLQFSKETTILFDSAIDVARASTNERPVSLELHHWVQAFCGEEGQQFVAILEEVGGSFEALKTIFANMPMARPIRVVHDGADARRRVSESAPLRSLAAERLTQAMAREGLTAIAVARELNVHPQTIYNVTSGRRAISSDLAVKLAKRFGGLPEDWREEAISQHERKTATTPQPEASPPSSQLVAEDSAISSRLETNTDLILDDPEAEHDALGRSILAIGLARRLHRIWCRTNVTEQPATEEDQRAAFVVHLDAPWGGGKTSFANFVARTLHPLPKGKLAAAFLRQRYPNLDVGGIFLDDPPPDAAASERLRAQPAAHRRAWIIVPFNAWQAEHCTPPWWIFYQSIRRQCFQTIFREGRAAWQPDADPPARLARVQAVIGRWTDWLGLWTAELWFRLTNPKIRTLLVTAFLSLILLVMLQRSGAWGITPSSNGTFTSGFRLGDAMGLLLAGLTGAGAIWGFGALLTESIVPGSDSVAERLSLGGGDPFERFRRHFNATMRRIRRPVLVVVDDLDRCRPEFVVDLVRGMQTLLRSSRVVFMILGDRDWIERAFETHYKALSAIDAGPEQSLGARFVEKAIQMSFILPALSREDQAGYVRSVLLGAEATTSGPGQISLEQASRLRELTNRVSANSVAPLESAPIVEQALAEMPVPDQEVLRAQVEQVVNEALAINAAVDQRVEDEIVHQLEALAVCFPANPRQIKRIVNAITIYYAVAIQRPGFNLDNTFRQQLALWIILMTEWPETWRLLAGYPELAWAIAGDEPDAAISTLAPAGLPGSIAATKQAVAKVAADPVLKTLIAGDGISGRPGISAETARVLVQLTPLARRPRRLDEPPFTAS